MFLPRVTRIWYTHWSGADLQDEGQTANDGPRITAVPVMVLYSLMGGIAYGLGFWLADRNVFFWHDMYGTTLPVHVAVGAGCGLAVVALSRVLERAFAWARELGDAMGELLGKLDSRTILVVAVFSALGEEMLFRGLLQPSIGLVWSSLIFGLLHVGPGRRYIPWTVMAVGMGFAFGGMFFYTGNLLAPILAHFTINYFNLHAIARQHS